MLIIKDFPFTVVFSDNRVNFSWKTESPVIVKENWLNLKEKLKIKELRIAYLSQIHGKRILSAKRAGFQGWGDGLITKKEELGLCIFVADCVPVLFYNKKRLLSGALHCGWRSLAAGIIENLEKLLIKKGIKPSETDFYIGAGINPCCYEVKSDVKAYFKEYPSCFTYRNERLFLDLPKLITIKLEKIGARTIHNLSLCTKCSSKFFSHRNKDQGRQIALIFHSIK